MKFYSNNKYYNKKPQIVDIKPMNILFTCQVTSLILPPQERGYTWDWDCHLDDPNEMPEQRFSRSSQEQT